MTISEGASIKGGDIIVSGEADAYGHRKLGGIGVITADGANDLPVRILCTSSWVILSDQGLLIRWIVW